MSLSLMFRRRYRLRSLWELLAWLALIALVGGCSRQHFARDQQITRTILAHAEELEIAYGLKVETLDGVVSITGAVRELVDKDELGRGAARLTGVRKVINRLDVVPLERADGAIREEILATLKSDPAAKTYPVNVLVAAGVVTLSGEVQFLSQKRLTQEIVSDVSGIKALVNGITTVQMADRAGSEQEWSVRRQVLSALEAAGIEISEANAQMASAPLVPVPSSVGFAAYRDSSAADAGALTVAWWYQEQSPKVDNTFAGAIEQNPRALERAIYARFAKNPRLLPFVLQVRMEKSHIVLNGTVSNYPAKKAAGLDALAVADNRFRVINQIRVRPERRLSDPTLEHLIGRLMRQDSVLKEFEIAVRAFDGNVYLTGVVASPRMVQRAESLVGRMPGVTDLHLQLQIVGKPATDPLAATR